MHWCVPAIALTTVIVLAAAAPTMTQPTQPKPSKPDRSAAVQTGFLFDTISAGGETIKYAVYVPRDYTPDKKWPLILFLHGSGESGSDGQKMIIQGVGSNILWHADRWPCIVLLPQKPVQQAQWERYDAPVMAMLERARRTWNIDDTRIALTGLSQGGHGTWTIGAAHPDLWCALAPICGYADDHDGGITPQQIAAKVKHIPMWIFHGEADDVVSPDQSRAVAAAMKDAGGSAKLTLYPNTNHGSWDKAYAEADLPAFLMTPRRK